MILKVVGCKDCVRENQLPLRGAASVALSRWAIAAIFSKKNSHLDDILHTFKAIRKKLW